MKPAPLQSHHEIDKRKIFTRTLGFLTLRGTTDGLKMMLGGWLGTGKQANGLLQKIKYLKVSRNTVQFIEILRYVIVKTI